MLFVWILTFWFVHTYQTSDPNCLRDKSGVLDAEFSFFNKMIELSKVTEADVSKHAALFSTRFQNGHDFHVLSTDRIKMIGDGLSLYKRTTTKSFRLFLSSSKLDFLNDVNEGVRFYKDIFETVKAINLGEEGPVVGLYVGGVLETYSMEIEAVNYVFGSKENSSFPIGINYFDCFQQFQNEFSRRLMQRQDFINCRLYPVEKASPEDSAEEVIHSCEKLKEIAISINLTANITCSVSYPSFGTTSNGLVGSVSNFQKFWCRIVDKVTQKNNSFRIIMQSAFDEIFTDYKSNYTNLYDGRHHLGWWRRRLTDSYEPSAFVEKVDDLEGGTEYQICNKECGFCRSSKECGPERICRKDTSIQPFEVWQQPRVCLSVKSLCAPRPLNGSTTPDLCSSLGSLKAAHSPTQSIQSLTGGADFFSVDNGIFVVVIFICFLCLP